MKAGRQTASGKRSNPDVLHEHRVSARGIEPDKLVRNPRKFAVMDERIDRDIDPDAPGMGEPDPFPDLRV